MRQRGKGPNQPHACEKGCANCRKPHGRLRFVFCGDRGIVRGFLVANRLLVCFLLRVPIGFPCSPVGGRPLACRFLVRGNEVFVRVERLVVGVLGGGVRRLGGCVRGLLHRAAEDLAENVAEADLLALVCPEVIVAYGCCDGRFTDRARRRLRARRFLTLRLRLGARLLPVLLTVGPLSLRVGSAVGSLLACVARPIAALLDDVFAVVRPVFAGVLAFPWLNPGYRALSFAVTTGITAIVLYGMAIPFGQAGIMSLGYAG